MSNLENAVRWVQQQIALAGITAPEMPTEASADFPFAVTFLDEGEISLEGGWVKGLHTLTTLMMFGRAMLAETVEQAIENAGVVPDALAGDPTLGGNAALVDKIGYKFGTFEYGGMPAIGYRYSYTIKIM